MAFTNKPFVWKNNGVTPPETLQNSGFIGGKKLPAPYVNAQWTATYKAIEELQQKAGEVKTVNNIQPDVNGNVSITLPDTSKFYQKPANGIPKTDLESSVQSSLVKADSALQSVTKADVGLGNVDNTSDANKPVSTAQQTALNQKANIASPTFTGTPKAPTATAGTNTTQLATTAFVKAAIDNSATTINDNIASVTQDITTHKADLVSHGIYGVATGTNALVMTDSKVTSYVDGMLVAFKNTTASTASTTLNINSLGAKAIVKANGTAVNNLKANAIYQLRYNGVNFTLLGEGGEYGNVTANDVRSTKTFGTEDGVIQGTLNLSNLLAGNVKKGINIGGVLGTLDIASLGGYSYASGSTISSGELYNELRVNGLSFTPRIIIVLSNDFVPGSSPSLYSAMRVIFSYKNKLCMFRSESSGLRFQEAPPETILSDGFYLYGLSSRQYPYDWFALG